MARVAPASWSFWAIPQAMERLLASPKTTAVLPARLIMLSFILQGPGKGERDQPNNRISAGKGISAAEVDKLDAADGAAKKAGAEALEFLDGVGGETIEDGVRGVDGVSGVEAGTETAQGDLSGGFGGVDDTHSCRCGLLDQRAEEGGGGASEGEDRKRTRLNS